MSDRAPDGQLTRVSCDTNGGNAYWYLGAQCLSDVSATLPDLTSPYILLILCDAEGLTHDELARALGKTLGWEVSLDLKSDLFGMVTVMRKR